MEKDKENKEKTFEDIGYSSWLWDTVKNKLQYDAPSDVQVSWAHICDLIKEGKFEHVLAQSKSGTGKTLAFLSIVSCFLENETIEEKIEEIESIHKPKVLILAPTREIAIQINDFAQFIMSDFPIKNISLLSCPVIGGLKTNETKANILIDKPLIVCGTLGRLIGTNFLFKIKIHSQIIRSNYLYRYDWKKIYFFRRS